MDKINFEKILNLVEPNGELLSTETAIESMKEAVRVAIPLILNKTCKDTLWRGVRIIDYDLEREIIKELGL